MSKPTAAEVDQRISAVYLLLLRRESRQTIVQYAATTWGVATRMADSYIARARALMLEEAREDRAAAIAEHLALRRDLYKRAYQAKSWAIAFQIIQDEAKMLGLYYSLADHLKVLTAAGYHVYEPDSPEAKAAGEAAIAGEECEVEIGLASPATGGVLESGAV